MLFHIRSVSPCTIAVMITGLLFLLPYGSTAAVPKPLKNKISISSVTDNLLSVILPSPKLKYGMLTPYQSEATDEIAGDETGNNWLFRNNEKIGVIVGPAQDHLYTLAVPQKRHPLKRYVAKISSVTISSTEDPAYKSPQAIADTGRLRRPIDSTWATSGLETRIRDELFLALPSPLQTGLSYTLTFNASGKERFVDFTFTQSMQISRAIHLSQQGFHPLSSQKTAYLSFWAGTLGGVTFPSSNNFQVVDKASGNTVFTGTTHLRKAGNETDEDAYSKNYNGTDVHELRFDELTTPGTYFIHIDGIGNSHDFAVSKKTWRKPFYHTARFLYHQRAGIELAPPYTKFIRSTLPDEQYIVKRTGARLMDTGNGFVEGLDNFSAIIAQRTQTDYELERHGYFDAGDHDIRIQHLLATRNLLDLYEQYPSYFSLFSLNIPESSNTIPDIIDEAAWPLRFFMSLQEPDGGIMGGIEAGAHPFFGEPSWLERHQYYVYHPGIWSTYLYVATAAKAARIAKDIAPELSADFASSALHAMAWAEQKYTEEPQPYQIRDTRNLAAVELYRLTGDTGWHSIFLDTTVFKQDVSNVPLLYRYEEHDQAEAAWSYLQEKQLALDPVVKEVCVKSLLKTADYLLTAQQSAGFGWLKDPWRPAFAGAFTIPFTRDTIRAAILTGEQRYVSAVEQAMHHVSGANPLNMSYTTGIGKNRVKHPYYPDARISNQEAPKGITVLGPLDVSIIGGAKNELLSLYGSYCHPDLEQWPVMETYLDTFWYPLMTEFSLETVANQVYSWGFLAAHYTVKPTTASMTQ